MQGAPKHSTLFSILWIRQTLQPIALRPLCISPQMQLSASTACCVAFGGQSSRKSAGNQGLLVLACVLNCKDLLQRHHISLVTARIPNVPHELRQASPTSPKHNLYSRHLQAGPLHRQPVQCNQWQQAFEERHVSEKQGHLCVKRDKPRRAICFYTHLAWQPHQTMFVLGHWLMMQYRSVSSCCRNRNYCYNRNLRYVMTFCAVYLSVMTV